MTSENELPVFDANATDFTKNLQQRTAQTSKRDMRYSQRNYGHNQRTRDYGDFGNRFNQDPNENVFSSSNSHATDKLKFLNKTRNNSRSRAVQNSIGLPVKKKNNRPRARTPKKLSLTKNSNFKSNMNKEIKNSSSSPKIQTEFFPKNVDVSKNQIQIQKQQIEEIMDPKKKKIETLKNFELKMEKNKETIDQLIENTIPQNSMSKNDVDAKTFFKEKVENSDRLKFETPAFGKQSTGLFDFNMNVDDIKDEDLFFKNKVKTPSDSVSIEFVLVNNRINQWECLHHHYVCLTDFYLLAVINLRFLNLN
jgi:hypothetical protein